jgi:hypothetical protein
MCRQAVHAAQRRRHALAASRHVTLLPTTSEPYEPPARAVGVRGYLGGTLRRWKARACACTAGADGSGSEVESRLPRNCPCRATRRGVGGTAPRAAPAAATARCRTSAARAAAFAARAARPPRRSSPGEASEDAASALGSVSVRITVTVTAFLPAAYSPCARSTSRRRRSVSARLAASPPVQGRGERVRMAFLQHHQPLALADDSRTRSGEGIGGGEGDVAVRQQAQPPLACGSRGRASYD